MSEVELLLLDSGKACTVYILILGNGGKKRTRSNEEDSELKGYVLSLQKFEQLLNDGVADGSVVITESSIETDKTFQL